MRSAFVFKAACAATICSPAAAQIAPPTRQSVCANDMAQVEALSAALSQNVLWDDAKIARARSLLAKLQTSTTILRQLTRRLNDAERSADNAEAFDRSGETRFWRRDAANIRAEIDSERGKTKTWLAAVGVSCPGCAYSVAISKVQAAIDGAIAARTAAGQTEQNIARYRSEMAANGCG